MRSLTQTHADTDKHRETEERHKQDKTGTSKRQETHDRQEIRDATYWKRKTKRCSQDDRDREHRGAWRVCGRCVWVSGEVCAASETDQTPTATAPPHHNPTLTHSTPSKRAKSPARPNPESSTKLDLSPKPSVPDQSPPLTRHKRNEHTEGPTRRTPKQKMNSVMMLLAFPKVNENNQDANPKSVWVGRGGVGWRSVGGWVGGWGGEGGVMGTF